MPHHNITCNTVYFGKSEYITKFVLQIFFGKAAISVKHKIKSIKYTKRRIQEKLPFTDKCKYV